MPGLAICLVQGSMLFFNSDYVEGAPAGDCRGLPAGTKWLLIDAERDPAFDCSAAAMLVELCAELRERGISLGLAELHAEAREMLERAGVIECIGADMVFDILEDAYQAFEARA